MAGELAAGFPEAAEALAEAESAFGGGLAALLRDGPEERLALTENAQPAILTTSIMALRVLAARSGHQPIAVAGHSLGEYTALVAAGVLDLTDAVRLVRTRGAIMQSAVPPATGAMAAVIGLTDDDVIALCQEAREAGETLAPANFNGGAQVVIAGHIAAVERAVALARDRGARLVRTLSVSAPFHCAMMTEAADRFADVLAALRFRSPALPIVCNVDGAVVSDAEALRDRLRLQMTQPVHWDRCVQALVDLGCTDALEVGPGNVLSGMLRRMHTGLSARPAGTAAALTAILDGGMS
jgi:[acyl-carrier-protein] S-malonyltransferase